MYYLYDRLAVYTGNTGGNLVIENYNGNVILAIQEKTYFYKNV